ncbi:MAG: ferrous iron transporter B [Planctomycetota bacterium]|nr:ferrous iron transporter B [Planctomycetota bacterium]
MRIILIGNPNVGKSALFSRMTGVNAVVSNYPGTTVEVLRGETAINRKKIEVIDAPGVYCLEPTCKAEEVAVELIRKDDIVVNVVDATNLERNLYLTLQLQERGVPVIVALNIWDEAKHKGITIDVEKLEKLLGVPVVPTVAVSGEGVKELVSRIEDAASAPQQKRSVPERWGDIGAMVSQVQKLSHRHHTFFDWLEDVTIGPLTGIPIAILVLITAFLVVRLVGEGLITYALDPLAESALAPFCGWVSGLLGGEGVLHRVLIGKLIEGGVDLKQSLGLLSTGLYVIVVMVLPYVLAFYMVLGFLEDIGYLPRLAVLSDVFMHRLGMHGFAVLPMLLGLGCNVPGLLATRSMESERERFIAATLLSIGVPCSAMQAMVIGLLGGFGWRPVAMVFLIMFLVWLCLGLVMRRLVKGFSPELLLEIPPFRWPAVRAMARKLLSRIYSFIVEAELVVLVGITLLNLLEAVGVIDFLSRLMAPVVSGLLGLPPQAVGALLLGMLRKDVAVGMLTPLALTQKQAVIAATVLAMFFPCAATFVVVLKELGWRALLKMTGIMLFVSLLVGSLLNFIMP